MSYTVADFKADCREPYAWPGGYPKFFICSDGGALSIAGAKSEARQVMGAIKSAARDSEWRVVGCEINWEDTELRCEHTGDPIPSAYGRDT